MILATLGLSADSRELRKYQLYCPWVASWSQGISASQDLELILGEGVIYKHPSVTVPSRLCEYTLKVFPPVMRQFYEAIWPPKGINTLFARDTPPQFQHSLSTERTTSLTLSPSPSDPEPPTRPSKRRRLSPRVDVIGPQTPIRVDPALPSEEEERLHWGRGISSPTLVSRIP